MSDIQQNQQIIEQQIDEWEKQRQIVDVSKKALPDGSTVIMRIQHSGHPFNVCFNGLACIVGTEESSERGAEFKWACEDVVKKVLDYIETLLSG